MASSVLEALRDPLGILLGLWHRLTGNASGAPNLTFDVAAQHLIEYSKSFRYMPEQMRDIIERNPNRSEPLRVLAEHQQEIGDWEALLATGTQIRRMCPQWFFGYRFLAHAQRRLGNVAEAEKTLLNAIHRFPANSELVSDYAICAQARGDQDEAFRRWQRAYRRFSDDKWVNLLYGQALGRLGRLDEAEAIYSAAVERWSAEFHAWNWYAEVADAREDWDEAIARWSDVITRFPSQPAPYARRARALRMDGQIARAVEVIEEAIFVFPDEQGVRAEQIAVLAARDMQIKGS
jgi:tetratricopeptide (TPR) repeat protein